MRNQLVLCGLRNAPRLQYNFNRICRSCTSQVERFDFEEPESLSRRQRKQKKRSEPIPRTGPSQELTVAFGELAEIIEESVKVSDKYVGPRLETLIYEIGQIQSMQMSIMSAYANEQTARQKKTDSLQKQIEQMRERISLLENATTVEWLHWYVSEGCVPDDRFLRSPGLTRGPVTWHMELKFDVTGKLGVYVAPRTVAGANDLISLKAKLEVYIRDGREKLMIESDFVRPGSRKVMSWGKFVEDPKRLLRNQTFEMKFRIHSQDVVYEEPKPVEETHI